MISFIIYLFIEHLIVIRRVRRIPLRICVTGTRGKSSLTRLLAASLREEGFEVIGKTTGSRAKVIFPDGREKEITRHGPASLLEVRNFLKLASRLRVKAFVAELMSIHPESLLTESLGFLKPNYLLITNIRFDHTEEMGSSEEEIAECFASAITENSTVMLLEEEFSPLLEERARKMKARVIKIPLNIFNTEYEKFKPSFLEFKENLALALGLMEFLGIKKEKALRAMENATPDFGSLRVWEAQLPEPSPKFYFVNVFAANDTLSTRIALSRIPQAFFNKKRIIGILNLRPDRGERTVQWAKAIREGVFPEIKEIWVNGIHSHAFTRMLGAMKDIRLRRVKEKSAQELMSALFRKVAENTVIVGMGNIKGLGSELVEFWEEKGVPYGL